MTLKDLREALWAMDRVIICNHNGYPILKKYCELPIFLVPEKYDSYTVLRINPCLSMDCDVDSEHKTYALQVFLEKGGNP